MSILPEDLIGDILLRLPVKSILRFKSVSKAWRTLISHSSFSKHHQDRWIGRSSDNQRPPLLLVTQKYYSISDGNGNQGIKLKFPFENLHKNYLVEVGYCNGLICCYEVQTNNIILWNPCTGEYQNYPYCFHPLGSLDDINWGFGFHPKTEEYKVLGIRDCIGGSLSKVHVYTVGSGSCRKLRDIHYVINHRSSRALVNGILHWWASSNIDRYAILSFNIEDEQFRQVPPPVLSARMGSIEFTLGVLEGCLSMLACFGSYYELWIMKDYGVKESWTEKFTINSSIFGSYSCKAFRLLDNGELLMQKYYQRLVCYSPPDYKTIMMSFENSGNSSLTLEGLVETLVSPKLLTLIGDKELKDENAQGS